MLHRIRDLLRSRSRVTSPGLDGRLRLDDLLPRAEVCLDTPVLQRFLAGRTVLVSGAGGSIGSEICRQMMRFCPRRLILLERSENALFEIDRELRERWIGADIVPCLADICDRRRVDGIFADHRPEVIFHAAAHKHVPMMERNPVEAIRNNVLGTAVVADAAVHHDAEAFVLISTDKAVNPTSVMGAAKRMAEIYVQSLNVERHEGTKAREGVDHAPPFVPSCLRASVPSASTRFLAVRFGNVLGSSGSVVPIFCRQIAAGGPVTVTHPQMQRYFMTIPEASQLVLQAGAIGRGGEVFILDMGQPVRIVELAEKLIRRHGLEPGRDIAIRFTGVRPGEKLHEELSCHNERTRPTSHPKIRVWQLPPTNPAEVARAMRLLETTVRNAPERAVAALRECVLEYCPDPARRPAETGTPALRLVQVPAAQAA